MIEALENIMPTFDPDITKIAKKNLIQSRDIDTKSNVFATKITPGCPVKIELTDAKSKEIVENLEVDGVLVATGRSPNSKNLNLDSVQIGHVFDRICHLVIVDGSNTADLRCYMTKCTNKVQIPWFIVYID